jgi:hypothetical protein
MPTVLRSLWASRHPSQFPQRSASIFVWLHTVNIHSMLYFCELFFSSFVRQVYYSLPLSPAQQTRMVPTLNAAHKLLKMCRLTSPIALKCLWRRTGRYSSYLKVLQNGDATPTSNYYTVSHVMYTVLKFEISVMLGKLTHKCTPPQQDISVILHEKVVQLHINLIYANSFQERTDSTNREMPAFWQWTA